MEKCHFSAELGLGHIGRQDNFPPTFEQDLHEFHMKNLDLWGRLLKAVLNPPSLNLTSRFTTFVTNQVHHWLNKPLG